MNENFLKIKWQDVKSNLVNLSQLVFEVTDVCNLSCKYCGYGELYEGFDPRGRHNLSFKKACNILDYLVKLWEENIGNSLRQPFSLGFYGGEPLMSMKLIKEIIQYVESLEIKSKKIHYNMTTNGLLLNKHMDYLFDKEFRLLISLDGNEKDHCYRVDHKGNNSHKQIIENIRFLQKKYPDYFNRLVNFNTVLHNMNSVESAHNFIKNSFGKETKISPLNNSGIRKDKVNEYINMFQNVDRSIKKIVNHEKLEIELFLEAPRIRQLATFLRSFSGNMFNDYRSLFFDANKIKPLPTGTCIPFWKKMFITVNGKILQCERINHEFALGQIFDDKIELNFDHIAEMANNYIFRFISQCNTCEYIRSCNQCVFQIDDLDSSDTKCRSYTDHNSFQNKINANLDYLDKNPRIYKRIMNDVHFKR